MASTFLSPPISTREPSVVDINQKSKPIKAKVPTCHHCHDRCIDEVITVGEYHFCCNGCLAVYNLISAHDLCDYYDIDHTRSRASLRLGRVDTAQYAVLDKAEVALGLGLMSRGEEASIRLVCPAITCASCLFLLDNLSKFNPAILSSRADFAAKSVTIWFRPDGIQLSEVAGILAKLGYPPLLQPPTADSQGQTDRTASRALLKRLGLAGFCTSNIMMLSFPAYLGLDQLLLRQLQPVFTVLSVLLSIMVVSYSAWPYYTKTWLNMRHGQLSVDFPIALAITTLLFRSLVEVGFQTGTGYFDSLSGLIFLLLIGQWMQTRYYEGLSFGHQLDQFLPFTCQVVSGKDDYSAPITRLVSTLKLGELVLIRIGETLPADLKVISAQGAMIDNAYITGESDAILVQEGEEVWAGAKLVAGSLIGRVDKLPQQSYLAQLWKRANQSSDGKQHSTPLAEAFVRWFVLITLGIALLSAAYWLSTDTGLAINAFTSVLMVACPCALTLAMPFASGQAVSLLASKGLYLKNGQVFEWLAQLNQIVFDKTGTLTDMGQTDGISWYNQAGIKSDVPALVRSLISLASTANNHPALLAACKYLRCCGQGQDPAALKQIHLLHIQQLVGQGLVVSTDHGLFRIGGMEFCGGVWQGQLETPADGSVVVVAQEETILGYFLFRQPLRPGLLMMMKQLASAFALSVSTGDSAAGASVLGPIQRLIPSLSVLFNQKPEDKWIYIKKLMEAGNTVLMVGDGLNDGPAMRTATIALAVTQGGHQFNPAADALVSDKALVNLPSYLSFAKSTLKMVTVSFWLSLVYNAIGLSMAVSGHLSPMVAAFFMPLSSLSVVALAVILTRWQAKRLLSTINDYSTTPTN